MPDTQHATIERACAYKCIRNKKTNKQAKEQEKKNNDSLQKIPGHLNKE